MRTLNRYLSTEITMAVLLVFAGLLMLFALLDLIHELEDLGKGGYHLIRVVAFVLLSIPGHIYELFPIAVLIGTLFTLAQLVANSEYNVMRVSGVSLWRMAVALLQIGLLFAALTFICGEFVAPLAERAAQQLRVQALTGVIAQEFRSGLWVKDDNSFVNVAQVLPGPSLLGIKIYEFDAEHRLRAISLAQRGEYDGDHQWKLYGVDQTNFEDLKTTVQHIAEADWRSIIDPALLSVLLVSPDQMSARDLRAYVLHLRENNEQTKRYDIALWNKAVYPFAVLMMMVLALPFAHFRQRPGNVGAKVFSGIMLGIGFHMLGRLFAYFGLLRNWPPFWCAAFPTLLFLSVALAMIWWEEKR